MRSRLSILGLYRYNRALFDLLQLPAGVNKEVLINRIMFSCYEYEVLFPDWDFMHFAIGQWSAARLDVWTRLASTLELDYDPIANYDRREDWSDTGKAQSSDKSSVSTLGSETANSESSETQSTAGFNTDEAKLHEVRAAEVDSSTESSGSSSGSSESSGSTESKHTGRVWGNIGVTSTQQLITQEREVSQFNLYDFIADDFAKEFCLLVY